MYQVNNLLVSALYLQRSTQIVDCNVEAVTCDHTFSFVGLFVHKDFLGIIGGRPGHSLYFIGFQDNKLIHLDPHLMQDIVDTSSREFPVQSYHCVYPRKCSFSSMDPSCALGFYCRTRDDFEGFLESVQPYLLPPGLEQSYPMFVVNEGTRSEHLRSV